jgi:hypothetical protein
MAGRDADRAAAFGLCEKAQEFVQATQLREVGKAERCVRGQQDCEDRLDGLVQVAEERLCGEGQQRVLKPVAGASQTGRATPSLSRSKKERIACSNS